MGGNDICFAEGRRFDVISLGRIGIDLYARQVNCSMKDISSFGKFIGGSPANITVGLSRLGLRTGFIGRIADDPFKKFILSYFKEHGIDTSGIIPDASGAKNQIAITEILDSEHCNLIMYRDKNVVDLKLTPEDISEEYIASAKVLCISGTALAAGPSREAVFAAIEYAIRHRVVIVMDIDYRAYNWKSAAEASIYYNLAVEKCDIILGTREEFDMLEAFVFPGNHDDKASAERLFDKCAQIVLIKHGKNGSTAFTRSGQTIEGELIPANVVNTFGAGDSYAASFIYGLLKGCSVKDSMGRGAAASSIVISRNDCSDAMPFADEVTACLEEYRKSKER